MRWLWFPTVAAVAFAFGFQFRGDKSESKNELQKERIIPGAFSISLSVKDLAKSKGFYESMGFKVLGGGMDQNYLVMKNGNALIGLFEGMFQGNILTFNPGWNENARNMRKWDDIRIIQCKFTKNGLKSEPELDHNSNGPASFMMKDPDGNVILFDQHR